MSGNPNSFRLTDTNGDWLPGMLDALFLAGTPADIPAMPAQQAPLTSSLTWSLWGGPALGTVNEAQGRITWASPGTVQAAAVTPASPIVPGATYQLSVSGTGTGGAAIGVQVTPGATPPLSAFCCPGQSLYFTAPAGTNSGWKFFMQADAGTAPGTGIVPFVCQVL